MGTPEKDWLAYLDLSSGIPPHDASTPIFRALQPEQFERCLVPGSPNCTRSSSSASVPTMARRCGRASTSDRAIGPPHGQRLGDDNRISLGQVAVAEKSNEITPSQAARSPELSRGGGDPSTPWAVRPRRREDRREAADYVLAVKRNQPTLHEGIISSSWTRWRTTSRVKVSRHETKERARSGRAPDVLCVRRAATCRM